MDFRSRGVFDLAPRAVAVAICCRFSASPACALSACCHAAAATLRLGRLRKLLAGRQRSGCAGRHLGARLDRAEPARRCSTAVAGRIARGHGTRPRRRSPDPAGQARPRLAAAGARRASMERVFRAAAFGAGRCTASGQQRLARAGGADPRGRGRLCNRKAAGACRGRAATAGRVVTTQALAPPASATGRRGHAATAAGRHRVGRSSRRPCARRGTRSLLATLKQQGQTVRSCMGFAGRSKDRPA